MIQTGRAAGISPSEPVDFVIVGSGAAGGIIAKELSTAGFSVVVLEQGPRLTEADFDHDEFGMFVLASSPITRNGSRILSARRRADTAPRPRADLRAARRRQQRPFHGQLLAPAADRLQRGERAWRSARRGARRLADYVRRAGALLHEGGVGAWRLRRARTVRRAALAAVSDAAIAGEVVGRADREGRQGARPSSTADADGDQLQPYNGRPACQHCGFCLFFMCEYRAKSTSMAAMLPLAEATGRCEIRPGSYVARVETTDAGRATGVTYFDAKKQLQLQRAKAVVLCANGAETPRLLLNSSSSRFPDGLANSSGAVGKHLMFNTYFGVNAQFEQPLNEFKSVQNTRMLQDFYETDPKRGFYGGGAIDARFDRYPISFALTGLPPGTAAWGEDFAKTLSTSSRARCSSERTARRCQSKPTASQSIRR